MERGGVSPLPEAQAEATEEATVRISAKKLANGRTEYGLQVQSAGAWSEDRLQPSSRFLSTNLREGRLSYSRQIELDSGHVVVISASLQASGQIEFGLHEVVDRKRGERQLPEQRLFPRTPPVGQWLNSSPLVLAGPVGTERFQPLVGARGWHAGTVSVSSMAHEQGVDTFATRGSEPIPGSVLMALTQACRNGQDLSLELRMRAQVEVVTVMSEQEENLVEVELSIDDGDPLTQYWQLERGEQHGGELYHVLSVDRGAAELLARLREASSVTVSVVGSLVPTPTFDLRDMFNSLVQENIDNCGDYADPAWQPLTEAHRGTTEAGVFYYISYPEHLDGGRRTEVRVGPSEETGNTDANSVLLRMVCDGQQRWIQLGDLPEAEQGEYTARSRIDDGEWTETTWLIRVHDGNWVYTNPPFDYEQLRGWKTLEIELPLNSVYRASFDLAVLFDNPVQTNIDNCGLPLWPLTYVPLVDVRGNWGELSYTAYHWRDEVHTRIRNTVAVDAESEGTLSLDYACYSELRVDLHSVELTDAEFRAVTLQIDGNTPETQSWRQHTYSSSDQTGLAWLKAPDLDRLISQLVGASSLTVTIDGSGLPPVTFDLTGMFDTPVQDNITMCGSHKPGETRNR